MTYTEQEINVKTTRTGIKTPRRAFVSEDGLFAINYTVPAWPGLGWTVTHVPTGHSLSSEHASRREAELIAAVWRALPINWNRKTADAITKQTATIPPQLHRWIQAVRPQRETEPKG